MSQGSEMDQNLREQSNALVALSINIVKGRGVVLG